MEVDLEYPKELHKLNNDYPLASDKLEIKREMSDNQLKTADDYTMSIGNVKKLVSDFFDKEKYLLHYKNLKIYFKARIENKKVNHVLEFNQSKWIKPYIKFNTQKRTESEKK